MRGSAASRTGVAPGGALAGPWVSNPLWSAARAVPSLDLRFAESKSLTDAASGQSLVTFTRASSGTYVGSDGVLKTATTNLLLRSEEFDNASWSKTNTTVTANQATAPDGSANADLIAGNAGTATKYIYELYSASTSGAFTFSVFAKAGTESFIVVRITDQGGVNEVRQRFDLSSGTLNGSVAVSGTVTAGSSSISAVANGWYRCAVTATFAAFTQLQGNIWLNSYASTALTTNFYLWGAQLEQSSTVGEYIPTTSTINSAPRFDHNPTTGESLGLLVEEQRTNSIRNNTMVGAVAGTPGTLPTNWVFIAGTTGISSQVVESGVVNGINYIDVRYFGTAAATSSFSQRFEGATSIAALTGQTWALSTWTKIQAGSTSGITAINHQYVENTSAGAFVTSGTTTITVDSNFTRHTSTRTLSGGATVAFLAGGISVTVTSGQAIDITLRIGLPQLEQGAFATSVIPTTGTTATRSADVASITGTNFSSWYSQSEGTVFASSSSYGASNTNRRIAFATDGTTSNRFGLLYNSSNAPQIVVASAGTVVANPNVALTGANYAIAAAYKLDDYAINAAGSSPSTDTAGALPVGINQLSIGSQINTEPVNGTIRRLTYWPARLANSTLQAITQ